MLKEEKTGGKKFMDFGGEILPYAAANNIKVRLLLTDASSPLPLNSACSTQATAGLLTTEWCLCNLHGRCKPVPNVS